MSGLSSDTIFIVLMGVTGAGKSNLIRLLSGDSRVVVGHNLTSETVDIQYYRFLHNKRNYVLVDTPGFDDTVRPNEEIVNELLSWLADSFRGGTRLNGILYLHRISDVRMTGSAFENLRMFRKLVGDQALSNVILVTTFWDTVSLAIGEERERELTTNSSFWAKMVEKGCPVRRLKDKNNRQAALEIIELVGGDKFTLKAQEEIVIEGKDMKDTAAARETAAVREEFEKKLREEQERVKREQKERELREKQRLEEEKRRLAREAELALQQEQERLRRERELEIQRQRQEQRRQEEEARRREAELKARIARAQAEQEAERRRHREEEERMRREYYRKYSCIGRTVGRGRSCDKCRRNLHDNYTYYYHCCHCDNDDWNQCGGCGNDCGTSEHPIMTQRRTLDDDCVIL